MEGPDYSTDNPDTSVCLCNWFGDTASLGQATLLRDGGGSSSRCKCLLFCFNCQVDSLYTSRYKYGQIYVNKYK